MTGERISATRMAAMLAQDPRTDLDRDAILAGRCNYTAPDRSQFICDGSKRECQATSVASPSAPKPVAKPTTIDTSGWSDAMKRDYAAIKGEPVPNVLPAVNAPRSHIPSTDDGAELDELIRRAAKKRDTDPPDAAAVLGEVA